MTTIHINNLPLPIALVDRLRGGGKWAAPSIDRIRTVFGENPSQAVFYDLRLIRFENESWNTETNAVYLGEPDRNNLPGDADPQRSVIIGDLGMDMPFALDYRNLPEPSVIFFGTRVFHRWITVAPNVASLISQLEA